MSHAPQRPRIPVIVGPTAGGKSDLAVRVALAAAERGVPAHVLAADALQVYRGMDIGTAKPTLGERRGLPHHLIDLVEPTDAFTVDDWLTHAGCEIARIRDAGELPIIVGGSNLYVITLMEGMFEGPEPDPELRRQLRAMPADERRAELERVDQAAALRIHPNDDRRTIRALEVFLQTGVPISKWQAQWTAASGAKPGDPPWRAELMLVGLEWETPAINARINARVKRMFELGLEAEARGLWRAGRLGRQAREALGYKQLVDWFEGRIATLDDAIERIKIETRRFAKNQRTWLKRFRSRPGGVWLSMPEQHDSAQGLLDAVLGEKSE